MLSVLDVSTNAVLEFSVERSGLCRVSDFFRDVEDELSTRSGECVRILSAAVGPFPVNVIEKTKTVRYFMLDCEPWCVQTAVFFSDSTAVKIKEISDEETGDSVMTLMCSKENCVKDIKFKVSKMTCRRISSIRLLQERRELPDSDLVANLLCNENIQCIYRHFKSTICAPYIYIPLQEGCVCESGGLVQKANSDMELPVWRRATPGMWLEGICMNEICLAYMKMVVMNQGFADIDFVKEASCICPICYGRVDAVQVGFTCCRWMTVGEKVPFNEEQDFPLIIREDWRMVPRDHYVSVHPNVSEWSILKVVCRKLIQVHFCVVCMKEVARDSYTARCGHVFHVKCFHRASNGVNLCCLCVARQVMTDYQLLFK